MKKNVAQIAVNVRTFTLIITGVKQTDLLKSFYVMNVGYILNLKKNSTMHKVYM